MWHTHRMEQLMFKPHASIGHTMETPYGPAILKELHYHETSSSAVFRLTDGTHRWVMSTEIAGEDQAKWKLGTRLRGRWPKVLPGESEK